MSNKSTPQGISVLIETLMQKSSRIEKYARCLFLSRGDYYSIEFLDACHRDAPKLYSLLQAEFSTEEMDPPAHFNACWNGVTVRGDKSPVQYKVLVVRNGVGEIVSIYIYGVIPLEPSSVSGDRLVIGFYAVTPKSYRGLGLNRELYLSALIEECRNAKQDGVKVAVVAGDVTDRSERAWNAVGRKRVYYQTAANSKEYTEVTLLMPSIGFNAETGILTEADFAPEHLMLQGLTEPNSREMVEKVMTAFYRWSEEQGSPGLRTEAVAEYRNGMQKFLRRSLDPLREATNFIFVTASERESMKNGGYTFT